MTHVARAIPPESAHANTAPAPAREIVWLAAADARGHLMRAHLVGAALTRRGARVRVVTTSEQGRDFLAAMGTPAQVLSARYGIAFDAAQNLDRARTDAELLRYLLGPSGAVRDAFALRAHCRNAALLINDFHPVPLVFPRRLGAPVVHVYGTHLWESIANHLAGRAPAAVDRGAHAIAEALRGRAHGRIEHSVLVGERPDARVLPPIVAAPARSREAVRASLGLVGAYSQRRLAAVYLNPHFRTPALAAAIESTLAREGYAMHAVGEGFATRPGWRAYDPGFNDVAAAADVLLSAPGMGAVAAWAHFGTPLVALLSDQPEQRANARDLAAARAAPFATIAIDELRADTLAAALRHVVAPARGPRPDPARVALSVHERWADALLAHCP